MAVNERFTDLDPVLLATMQDVTCVVQNNVSYQETLQQVFTLMLANTILSNSGNPNGTLGGQIYQLCWDTVNQILYVCTLTGSAGSAVWITAGNPGIISPSMGGTGVVNPTAHTFPIAEGSSNYNFIGPLTNGQILMGITNNDPMAGIPTNGTNISWTPGSGSLQANLTGTVAAVNGGSGVSSPTLNTLPIANGSSPYNFVSLTNGQLLIGSTGSIPIANRLTAGTGIAITNTAGAISISAPGGTGFSWTVLTAGAALASNNGYFCNGAAPLGLSLPVASNVGDVIQIVGMNTGNGWSVSQAAGQQIVIGTSASTTGAAGFISSTQNADAIYLVCSVANLQWTASMSPQGNITVS